MTKSCRHYPYTACINATFSTISVISWQSVLLVEETGKNHRHIMLYRIHLPWAVFELTTLVVVCTDCIGSCKSTQILSIYKLVIKLDLNLLKYFRGFSQRQLFKRTQCKRKLPKDYEYSPTYMTSYLFIYLSVIQIVNTPIPEFPDWDPK